MLVSGVQTAVNEICVTQCLSQGTFDRQEADCSSAERLSDALATHPA